MSFQILQRAYAPFETLANFPPYGDSRLVYRATDTGYIYTWDVTAGMYKLASISPDHTHNYAGSSSAGGEATTALACTGNAATATALATPRTIKIGAKSLPFDGTTDREYTVSDIGALGVPDVGSWMPVITSNTPPNGVTYYWRSGSYVRMGGVCFAWFGVGVSSLGSGGGGDLMITGLPFVCRNTGAGTVWMPGGFFAGLVNAIDAYANAIGVNEGTNNAIFGRCNNLGMSAIPITDATNSLIVCGLIIYQTA